MSRSDKVSREIKREVGKIVQEELSDPRFGFITVTRVDLKPDLRFARIFYSVYGSDSERQETQAAMEHACGFIRRLLGQRLQLRYVPEIVFRLDRSSEQSILIQDQLEKIKQEDSTHGSRKTSGRHPKKNA